jgi:predicted secreted protein
VTAWQDLSVPENNDRTFTLDLTYNGAPFNPTNYTLSLVLKSSASSTDASGTTFTTSSGLTIVNAALGIVTWKLPHTNTGTPGAQWWRIDAVDGSSNRMTLMMGNLTVQAV